MDTDIVGVCTEQLGIRGPAITAGGASASGQVAVLQAAQAVQSGEVDICIAIGGLMDLSHWELQALRSLGAMGTDRFAAEPAKACRPFDAMRDGFIFGEACGALVIERADPARAGARPRARLSGWAMAMDANRNPNPSLEGEISVIRGALSHAGLSPREIDYVNPHGSGSVVGDEIELRALRECGLDGAWINATKSITGHALTAAGAVEIIATILQMDAGRLHPSLNLEEPIDGSHRWVRAESIPHRIEKALSVSLGFGGVNTAICLQRCD
jgi:malonyl-ACP decarboxylase